MNELEREISLHKDRWCKFNCKAGGLLAILLDEEDYVKDKDDVCKFCQVDSFIKELIVQKVITKRIGVDNSDKSISRR